MGRRPDPSIPSIQYKGVGIRLYRNHSRWKATFQLHGQKRRECYGPTQAEAQKAAQEAIAREINPQAAANGRDEVVARALLRERGASLTDAAQAYISIKDEPEKKATVRELRSELVASLANEGYHNRRSLEDRTQHFEDAFAERQIASIRSSEVFTWLGTLKTKGGCGSRTVRNIFDATKYMFQFARSSGYLIADRLSAVEQLKRPRAESGKKEVYLPSVMQLLLDAAWGIASPAAPALAATGFGAIRSEELFTEDESKPRETRLCWEDFFWKEDVIKVRKETDKNKRGRIVPIRKNLRQMLYTLRGKGPLYTELRLDLEYAKIAAKAGVVWKANAHRHSAITYDLLISRNPAEVANRSGNSLAVIESSYRNPFATRSQAVAWFKLHPQAKWASLA